MRSAAVVFLVTVTGTTAGAQTREDTLAVLRAWAKQPPVEVAKPSAPGFLLMVSVHGGPYAKPGPVQEVLGQLCAADSSFWLDVTRFEIIKDTAWIAYKTAAISAGNAVGTTGAGSLVRRANGWEGFIVGTGSWEGIIKPDTNRPKQVPPRRTACLGR